MKNKLPRSGNRATAITKSIGVFIAKDMRPYSVVENKGFQHMINVLEFLKKNMSALDLERTQRRTLTNCMFFNFYCILEID